MKIFGVILTKNGGDILLTSLNFYKYKSENCG